LEVILKIGNRWKQITSLGLVVVGLGLFILALIGGTAARLALPLLIIVLGAVFIFMVSYLKNIWIGAPWFYLPGCLLISLGLILFLNVATGDWNSWAYAWLLLVAGLGIGTTLLGRDAHFSQLVTLIGLGTAAAGVTFFATFGMLVGSPFIQIMAPLLLVVIGFILWRLKPETLSLHLQASNPSSATPNATLDQTGLTEPLSIRELEVLRLIDQGLTNAVIADRLIVASSTVKTHINNIYSKLGVQSRVQAIKRAHELGLL
jgi:DNA-binding CsgD family transcriptional regulator